MSITLAQICDAIESTLGAATILKRSESYDELSDGLQDLPMLQVYWEATTQSPPGGTDRHTFGGSGAPVRQSWITIYADYYARQRAHLAEDMKSLVDGADEIQTILEAQDQKPYFNLDGIQAFSWEANRVTFDYAGVMYIAARFIIQVRVF